MTGQDDPLTEDSITEIDFGTEIDLHHFHPDDTAAAVEEFLRQAVDKGYDRVRIVHGKGMSKKKKWVYSILKEHSRVALFRDDGPNWGATVVYLDKK